MTRMNFNPETELKISIELTEMLTYKQIYKKMHEIAALSCNANNWYEVIVQKFKIIGNKFTIVFKKDEILDFNKSNREDIINMFENTQINENFDGINFSSFIKMKSNNYKEA